MNRFHNWATKATIAAGQPWAFGLAFALVLGWTIGGFFIGFSNQLYQLWINTATTIVTFLMVFLIQNTQNRDNAAFHIKLDELIRSITDADNQIIDIEKLSPNELEELRGHYTAICARHTSEGEPGDRPTQDHPA